MELIIIIIFYFFAIFTIKYKHNNILIIMNNSVLNFPIPQNEPVKEYKKGSIERVELEKELERFSSNVIEIPAIVNGQEIFTGITEKVVMPHNRSHVLAIYHKVTEKEVNMAIDAALNAHREWSDLHWSTRASIMLKIADLITIKYRATLNAATMLGQSKNIYQAEIDAVCETADFLRFNVSFASDIYRTQPQSSFNQLNKIEYRPLEGFVFAISPFNFTSIASNLNLSPVMMGNTTLWKPATTALLSNYILMQIFKEAGVPDGVINFLPGSGSLIGGIALNSKHLAGVHFTGSNATFNSIWRDVSKNLSNYISYPRLVGETGGKDFIFVHPSADVDEVAASSVAGAFEYQGQKCSAASRVYIPKSLEKEYFNCISKYIDLIKVGDVCDYKNFVNAVIDEKSYDTIVSYIDKANKSEVAEVIFGGNYSKEKGYFIDPTIILTTDPNFITMEEEIFGPVLTVYVYEDDKIDEALTLCDTTSPYALTGAVFGKDRVSIANICSRLRYSAGNFYLNDKPTGAVVGRQPFGGARGSGTNDKAGGPFNLLRWISPRTIKETFVLNKEIRYGYMME